MSLSDALFEAELEAVSYLERDGGDLRERIERLLEEMDAVRMLPGFDTPPDCPAPPGRSAEQIIAHFQATVCHVRSLQAGLKVELVGSAPSMKEYAASRKAKLKVN